MIITLPVEITTKLMAISARYNLAIPIPLSSPWQSYASPEELDLIQKALYPLMPESEEVAAILATLESSLHQKDLVVAR
ncbi:MAG TPA: hypothetical protein V6D29_10175 [Leptolyngbyaceae cyanobacterium]